jgi:predicted transcriptional regulator
MKKPDNIKAILKLFYGYLPIGTNYFTLTYKLNLEIEEWVDTFEYLLTEGLVENWGNNDKQIITSRGIKFMNSKEIHENIKVYENG